MAALMHQESRRLYSWWWDSHISPKNSKWLQENLTDMDAKVKAMIKLIEEDADSFARRAEMYYKKRPELMKLVEEFYRAYRALAERYNHATVELRHAHKTMAEAFPNQSPYSLSDDSSQDSAEPRTLESSHPIRALLSPDDLQKCSLGLASSNLHALKNNKGYSEESESGGSKRGLKQLKEMFGPEGKTKKGENVNEAENEVENLKKTLAEIEAEKEAILLQYQKTLQNFLERELNYAQNDANGLDERASKADIEIKVLKEALVKLQGERDDGLLRYNNCLERISSLESMISHTQEDAKGLNERASKAEVEAQNLKQELLRLEAEKEGGLEQYKRCLEMISALENKISLAEENSKMLNEQTERAESEVQLLKQALARLKEEKDAVALRYEQCLEKMANMEKEIFQAQEDSKRLNDEIIMGNAKMKNVEKQCSVLESSNESLQAKAANLAQKIAEKDEELSLKQKELEKLQLLLEDEHTQFVQVEATLQALQKMHSQTQEEQRALTLELQNKIQLLKDLEICHRDIGKDVQKVRNENETLHGLNNLSAISMKNLQDEILSLREMKEKLEEEIAKQMGKSDVLQQEVYHLKEEITGLNGRYQALVEQVIAVGLNPEFLESSVRDLQDENLKLKEVCNKQRNEKEALYEKLRNLEHILGKNAALEGLVLELNGKLGGSNQRVEDLKESCQFLQEERSSLVSEKTTLLSQLQIMTENMQKLLEKNILLENSLSGANAELQGLRAKSKSLEEFCQLLKDEKSNLIYERGTLVSQLENIERRLGNLENRFVKLEDKYSDLEKEKESTLCQVEELRDTLSMEQQERASYVHSSESRLADLENHVNRLEEERILTKKEFEEELDKAVNAQVEIFILQKFIEDLEEKNLSLMIECQKHVEASNFSDKLISELECENLEQQVEAELLLDEIAKLRTGIYKIFKVLPLAPTIKWHEYETEKGQNSIPRILNSIEDLKSSVSKTEDEKQKLLVENSVLLTLLQHLQLDGSEVESEKRVLEEEFKIEKEQREMLQKDKSELLDINRKLMLKLNDGEQKQDALKAELLKEGVQLANLQSAYVAYEEKNYKLLEEKETLTKEFSALEEDMCVLKEENGALFEEALHLSTLVLVLECFSIEKVKEVKELTEELDSLSTVNSGIKEQVNLLGEKLEQKEAEISRLNKAVENLNRELDQVNEVNSELSFQILAGEEALRQKAVELLEAEGKLRATHNLNAELCRTVDDLKNKCQELKVNEATLERQILEVSEDCTKQKAEINCLNEVNRSLESEVGILNEEIEEQKIREVYLSSELQEKSYEFELWESEAASFYFDLQTSSVREVLLENKVQELTIACESLEDEGVTKSLKIEEMKEKVGGLESEIGNLKVQLSSYVPVIASLRGNIASFEHNVLGEKNLRLASNAKQLSSESVQSIVVADGISELHELETRIKTVEQAVVEEIQRLAKPERKKSSSVTNDARLRRNQVETEDDFGDNFKQQKGKPEISEVKIKTLMKDIPLDQVSGRSFSGRSKREISSRSSDRMLGLWESAEQDCILDPAATDAQNQSHHSKDTKLKNPSAELQVEKELGVDKQEISRSKTEPNKEENNGKMLKRLASDAQKLVSLKTTLQELRRKMETSKRGKKVNDRESENVKIQLKEAENDIFQLVEINNKLTNETEKTKDSGNDLEDKVSEEARKGSEMIGRLQIEVQSIQDVLMKLDDQNKAKGGKSKFQSRTSVLLREFIWSGRSSAIRKKKKKKCLCGCMRPSTSGDY